MKIETEKILEELIARYPNLEEQKENILNAFLTLLDTAYNENVIYVCGNGGSMADSIHIVGELVKCFRKKRDIRAELKENLIKDYNTDGEFIVSNLEGGIRAHSLGVESSLITAYANDRNPDMVYAQEVSTYGKKGDTLIAISTSGNAKNCIYAIKVAKALNMSVVALTGKDGGKMKDLADNIIIAKEFETFKIQELHLPIYHALCAMLESELF